MRTPALIALLLLLSTPAAAATFLGDGDAMLPADRVIDDDLYVAGGNVRIEGRVLGDLVVAGGDVVLLGEVGGDLIAAAGSLQISGKVQGTIRAAAGRIRIEAPVGADLVLAGGEVVVAPDATVARDVVVNAGRMMLQAKVMRHAWISAGDAEIDADIGGDLNARAGTLRIGSVTIGGDLVYPRNVEAEIAADARILGATRRTEPAGGHRPRAVSVLVWILRMLVGFWALGALFRLAAPRWTARAVDLELQRPGAVLLGGLAILLVTPLLAALVFGIGLLVGGWWIGLVVMALYGIAILLAIPLAAFAVGRWLASRIGKRRWAWPLILLGGLVVLVLLFAIPIAGALLGLLAVLFGLGGLGLATSGAQTDGVPR